MVSDAAQILVEVLETIAGIAAVGVGLLLFDKFLARLNAAIRLSRVVGTCAKSAPFGLTNADGQEKLLSTFRACLPLALRMWRCGRGEGEGATAIA